MWDLNHINTIHTFGGVGQSAKAIVTQYFSLILHSNPLQSETGGAVTTVIENMCDHTY